MGRHKVLEREVSKHFTKSEMVCSVELPLQHLQVLSYGAEC